MRVAWDGNVPLEDNAQSSVFVQKHLSLTLQCLCLVQKF